MDKLDPDPIETLRSFLTPRSLCIPVDLQSLDFIESRWTDL